MRTKSFRDTFFILINCKTGQKIPEQKNREPGKTPLAKNNRKSPPKSLAHPSQTLNQKSGLLTGVYQNPPAQTTRNSRQTKNTRPIQKSPVNKNARIFPRFKIVNVW